MGEMSPQHRRTADSLAALLRRCADAALVADEEALVASLVHAQRIVVELLRRPNGDR